MYSYFESFFYELSVPGILLIGFKLISNCFAVVSFLFSSRDCVVIAREIFIIKFEFIFDAAFKIF